MSVEGGLSSLSMPGVIVSLCLVFANVKSSGVVSTDWAPSVSLASASSCWSPAPGLATALSPTRRSCSGEAWAARRVTSIASCPWWLRALEWLSPESELMRLVVHAALLQAIIGRRRLFSGSWSVRASGWACAGMACDTEAGGWLGGGAEGRNWGVGDAGMGADGRVWVSRRARLLPSDGCWHSRCRCRSCSQARRGFLSLVFAGRSCRSVGPGSKLLQDVTRLGPTEVCPPQRHPRPHATPPCPR